jgi:hypothetical protein
VTFLAWVRVLDVVMVGSGSALGTAPGVRAGAPTGPRPAVDSGRADG